MGHDVHFLQRLERVSLPQMELALSLYNDAGLVRAILNDATVPEATPRVAIALEDSPEGPFIVMARDGHFVTCLGQGMSVGDLPVITRPRLDAISGRVERLRERIEAAAAASDDLGQVQRLIRRLQLAGDELSQEEFDGLTVWAPWLAVRLWEKLLDLPAELEELRRGLRKARPGRKADEPQLRLYWQKLGFAGHLLLLTMSDVGREIALRMGEVMPLHLVSWIGVGSGISSLVLRAAWAAGRMGKPALPAYKAALAGADSPLRILNACVGLLAIGLRSSRSAAEVEKVFLAAGRREAITSIDRRRSRLAATMGGLMSALKDPDQAADFLAHCTVLGLGRFLPVGCVGTEATARLQALAVEIDPGRALAAATRLHLDCANDAKTSTNAILLLTWAARAEARDFYLPRGTLQRVARGFDPDEVFRLLAVLSTYRGSLRPIRSAPLPGRNEPCVCGSGLKFKHCCLGKAPRHG